MSHHKLLHIYDAEEDVFEPLAYADYELPVTGGLEGLKRSLDSLVSGGHTFTNAIILAHGAPGLVRFNGESLNRYNDILFNPDYRRLFPFGGKIIFDGCEVAAGDDGTAFLAAVGRAFFKKSGGVVIGPTRLQIVLTGPLYYALVAASGPFFTMARGRSVQLNVLGKTSFIGAYKAAVFTPGGFLIHVGFL